MSEHRGKQTGPVVDLGENLDPLRRAFFGRGAEEDDEFDADVESDAELLDGFDGDSKMDRERFSFCF